jgi:hypothetical protein
MGQRNKEEHAQLKSGKPIGYYYGTQPNMYLLKVNLSRGLDAQRNDDWILTSTQSLALRQGILCSLNPNNIQKMLEERKSQTPPDFFNALNDYSPS